MATKKSGTGLSKETSAALSYLLGPITGVLFFVLEQDKFVRFHAMQSIVTFVALFVLQTLLGITIILSPLIPLVGLVMFILWLVLIYKAWQGDEWEVPVLGKFTRQMLEKVK